MQETTPSSDKQPRPGKQDRTSFKSLNIKLLIVILLASALFSIATTSIQLYIEHQKDLQQLDERITSINNTHIPALSLSVWSVDTQLIETQLNSLLAMPDIFSVELSTRYGENFSAGSTNSQKNLKTYRIELYSLEEQSQQLGTLLIRSDLKNIDQRINDRMLLILATEAVKTFLVALVIMGIVQLLVTRHLATIASYIKTMRLSQLNQPLKLNRKIHTYRDELDTFVSAFNRMRETFRKDLDLLEEIQLNLQQSEEKYRLAMQATQDGLWDWDIAEENVYFSPSWGQMLKLDDIPQEFDTWHSRLHPVDAPNVMKTLEQHLQGKTPLWQHEHRLKCNDGQWLWVLGRGQVVKRDNQNRPLRMIGTMSDIHHKKQTEEIIWQQANFDALTNLPNRKFLSELLEQEIRKSERHKLQVWLLFLDLDGFKEVNDSLGHQIGDMLLRQVAERLQKVIRNSDIAGRLSGDEFVVIFTDVTDVTKIDYFASRLIEDIGRPFELQDNLVKVTASIGIANFPNDADNAADLLKYADQSMYVAKKEGKNRYTYFTPALQSASVLRKQISLDLHRAIEEDQYELNFQPIIDARTGDLLKAEVLLRWNHPDKGRINPGAFIPIAEETGVICDIGSWVFKHALQQLHKWRQQYQCEQFKLTINMSPLQLQSTNEEFFDWVNLLELNDLKGEDIILEITEGLLLKDDEIISSRLKKLRASGLQIAIDDFGTGYSSLSYLNELDVDYLKIDQSFVKNLSEKSSEETLCQAIIVMAHKLGLQVIAEGVETREQAQLLNNMHCDQFQGYLFAKPMSAKDFAGRYLENKPA